MTWQFSNGADALRFSLADHWDKPSNTLPPDLAKIVARSFRPPLDWDSLGADQRKQVAELQDQASQAQDTESITFACASLRADVEKWLSKARADSNDGKIVALSDVLSVLQSISPHVPAQSSTTQARFRSDREEALLRVIAGLWALSSLPRQHNSTADKLSALFAGWGWDKPAKSTIADNILKPAASLPGANLLG